MTANSGKYEQLSVLFIKQFCWMIEPLALALNYSITSVRRFLTEVGYYSSFTHNRKWYTLSTIPKFNRDGLWFYNETGFSRVGSLTKTLIDLTNKSPAGLTAEQLGEKLHCRCHTVLVQLHRQKKIERLKIGRAFVYIAVDSSTGSRQRQAISLQSKQMKQLPAEIAVLVLVEYICNPKANFARLAKAIKLNRKVTIDVMEIERLFQQYGLKKTM